MLRPQFEDHTDSNDYILKIAVIEGLALPLVPLILPFPEFTCQLGSSVLPASTDAHALVELDAHF